MGMYNMKKELMYWTWWAWEPIYFYNQGESAHERTDLSEEIINKWYDEIHCEKTVASMAETGINCAVTHFYKGFGFEFEKKEMNRSGKLTELCNKYGIKVFGYIQYGSIFHESFFKETPEAENWVQMDENGTPHLWWEDKSRYLPCINHPEFMEYLKKCIKYGIKKVKLDGLHFDNFYSRPCYCKTCQDGFRKYLQTEYASRETDFELSSFADVLIPPENTLHKPGSKPPLVRAWIKYRQANMNKLMHSIKSYAKSLDKDIMLLFNPTTVRGLQDQLSLRSTDIWDIGSQAQFLWAEGGNHPGIRKGCLVNQVNYFKTAEAIGYRILSTTWKNHSEGNGLPDKVADISLNTAESAMFGAEPGANWLLRATPSGTLTANEKRELTRELEKYFQFIKKNENIYNESSSCADIAIYLSTASRHCDFNKTYGSFLVTQQILLQNHIPFNIVFAEQREKLFNHSIVILPETSSINEDEVNSLTEFADNGGKIMCVGNHDDRIVKNKNVLQYITQSNWLDCIVSNYTTYVYLPEENKAFVKSLNKLIDNDFYLKIQAPETVLIELRKNEYGQCFVHLLNYRNTEKVRNIAIQLNNAKLSIKDKASYLNPDEKEVIDINGKLSNKIMNFMMPEFETYAILVLTEVNKNA